MSKYGTIETQITDSAILVDALCDMGWSRDQIEVNETPKQLIDFQGHATHYLDANGDKAEIIIRRKYVVGMSNDIGFRKNPLTGRFEAIISEYDRHHYDAKWRTKLEVNYATRKTIAIAAKQGLKFAGYGPTKNGKRELNFVKG